MGEAWIIDAVRTPRGKGKKETGALSGIHPQALLAQCLVALQSRNGFDPNHVEDLIAGCVSEVNDQAACIARNAVLAAGWDARSASGVTLNRFCGSGQQAVNFAAMGVMAGQQDLVIGGGVESMSRVPMGSTGGGLDGNNPELVALHPLVPQGISADLIATLEGFTREDLDRFAAQSQERCAIAQKEDRFEKSLVPVRDPAGKVVLDRDEFPRAGTSAESLAKLAPSFEGLGAYVPKGDTRTLDQRALSRYTQISAIHHVHHAGNSSGIVDGAGAGHAALPRQSAHDDRRRRPHRDQRSLRRDPAEGDARPRYGPRQGERERRRHRARPSARRHRRDAARHRARRARAPGQDHRSHHDVHRRRHGDRDDHRKGMTK